MRLRIGKRKGEKKSAWKVHPNKFVVAAVGVFGLCFLAKREVVVLPLRSLLLLASVSSKEQTGSAFLVPTEFLPRSQPHTGCAAENHHKLQTLYGIQLEARQPHSKCTWDAVKGCLLRVPVYNTYTGHPVNNETDWKVHLWARLVTDHLILPTTFVRYHYHNIANPGAPSLFAELEFHVWEPGAYQLEVDLRYIYGGTNSNKIPFPYLGYSKDANDMYSNRQPHPSLQLESINGVFPSKRHEEINAHYMARENDLQTWTKDQKGNYVVSHWKPFHENWVKQQCMAIVNSPYHLTIEFQGTNGKNHTTASATRFCSAADTQRPGYWQVLNGKRQERPFLLRNDEYHHQWDKAFQGPQLRYVTPGCDWEFPNATRLLTCLRPYNYRLNMAGDSLIRMLTKALKSYFDHVGVNITFELAVKGKGVESAVKCDVTSFALEKGGAFIDDFNLIHHVGWGRKGDLVGKQSSPGRLAYELKKIQSYLEEKQVQRNSNSSRFFYYVAHYINEFRCMQGFEPFVSHYSAIAAEYLEKESVYEIFDTNRVVRPLVDGTGDGLHYHLDVVSMLAVMMLNSICD